MSNPLLRSCLSGWTFVLAAALLLSAQGQAADVNMYLIAKGLQCIQSGSGMPALAPNPYSFSASVQPSEFAYLTCASLQLPNLSARPLLEVMNPYELKIEQSFASKQALDNAYPAGTYVFTVDGPSDGIHTPSLVLTNDAYPNSPHVSNWAAAQNIEANTPFTLTWDSFSGGTARDFIQLRIEEDQGGTVFETPAPGQPDALTGVSTGITLPAGTLIPGQRYVGQLLFVRIIGRNTTGYPGAVGYVGYYKETRFTVNCANPAGCLQFSTPFYAVSRTNHATYIPVVRVGGTAGAVSVQFSTYAFSPGPGSATAEVDFRPASGQLDFAPGETSKQIELEILPNSSSSGPQSLGISLYSPEGGATLVDDGLATLTILDPSAPNTTVFGVAKGVNLRQTNAAVPVPGAAEMPYQLYSFVESAFIGSVTSATLRLPGGATRVLAATYTHLELAQDFVAKSNLDSAFPNGVYTLTLGTLLDGACAFSVSVSGDAYPSTPHLANWLEAQQMGASAPFAITWDAFANGGAGDFIKLSIENESGQTVWQTPELGQANGLNGTATSATLPGNVLAPRSLYRGRLLFAKVVSYNSPNDAGALGFGAYFKQTEFPLATLGPGATFQFDKPVYEVSESSGDCVVTVVRTSGLQEPATVFYSTDDASLAGATPFEDYMPANGVLNFQPGETNKFFFVHILNDDGLEGPESVRLQLGNFTDASISEAVLTITDDEALNVPNVSIYAVSKGLRYRQTNQMSACQIAAEAPFLFYAFADEAFPGGIESAWLRRPAGGKINLTRMEQRFGFSAMFTTKSNLDSAFPAGKYGFSLDTLYNGVGTNFLNLPAEQYPPTPHISNWEAAHDIDSLEDFTLTWDVFQNSTDNDSVHFQICDGYGGSLLASPGLLEGALEGTAHEYTIPAGTLEANRTYYATLMFVKDTGLDTTSYPEVPGLTGFCKETTFTLTTAPEARPGGRFEFSAREYRVAETGGLALITVHRTRGDEGVASVAFATVNGTATAGLDYSPVQFRLVFAEGQTTTNIAIPILDDAMLEGTETLTLNLSNPQGALLGPCNSASLRIEDNESAAAGTLQFSSASYTNYENVGLATITVVRTGPTNRSVSVQYATRDGSALAGTDFTPVTGSITFAAGQTKQTFKVPLLDNTILGPSRSLTLLLFSPTGGACLGSRTNATLVIRDYETVFQLSQPNYTASESAAFAAVSVLRNGPNDRTNFVYLVTSPMTAVPGLDYTNLTKKVIFPPGVSSVLVKVPLANDSLEDGEKAVLLTLTNPSPGALFGAVTNAVLTISDNDRGGVINFSASAYSVSETSKVAIINLTRSNGLAGGVTVDLLLADDTAVFPLDYTNQLLRVSFAAGQTNKAVWVPIVSDTLDETNETVLLSLASPTGVASLGSRTSAVLTIVDDDSGGTLAFSTNSFRVSEAGDVATITVVRTRGVASGVTVRVTTSDGSGVAGDDYAAVDKILSFGPGQTTAKLTIPVYNNSQLQPDRTVSLLLSDPTGGAKLGSPSMATLKIVDDEPENAFGYYSVGGAMSLSGCMDPAGNGYLTFTGSLNIYSQTGKNFTGSATLYQSNGYATFTQTLKGTIDSAGKISGTYSYQSVGEGGSGTFTGTVSGKSISLSFNGQASSLDTCSHAGWMNGNW